MKKKFAVFFLFSLILISWGCKKERVWSYRYNEKGQIAALICPDKAEIQYEYDARGNVTAIKAGNSNVFFDYNKIGGLNQIRDNSGTTKVEADSSSKLKSLIYPGGESIKYDYSDSGTLAGVIWEGNHFLKFSRDLLGNVIKIETPAGAITQQYDYNAHSFQRFYPNGAVSQFQYNADGLPLHILHTASGGRLILELHYKYDDAQLLVEAQEQRPDKDLTISYSYDNSGQLKKAEYSDGRVYAYEYDAFGNRTKYQFPGGNITAAYNDRDQLKTFAAKKVEHDAAGNVTQLDNSQFSYDFNNFLINDDNRTYAYNALGFRVEEQGTNGKKRFIHFLASLPYTLAEIGDSTIKYLWSDGQCLGQIVNNKQVLFFLADNLGSIRCAVDDAGNPVGYAEFDPFGVPQKRIDGVRFGFCGEEQDESGKVYLRARYYSPHTGRFLSPDKVVNFMDVIKQNRYAYAANSPLNLRDVSGAYPIFNYDYWKWNQFLHNIYISTNPFPKTNFEFMRFLNEISRGTKDDYTYLYPNREYLNTNYTARSSYKLWDQNYAGFKNNPDSLLGENSSVMKRLSDYLGWLNYDAVYHDIPMNRGDRLPYGLDAVYFHALNFLLMPPAHVLGSTHYAIDMFMGPEYTAVYRARLQELAKGNPAQRDNSSYNRQDTSSYNDRIYFPNLFDSQRRNNPFLPPGGGGGGLMDTPNVGGVYLNKAAEVIGDLGGIEGVTFDPVSNRLILMGSGKNRTALPALRPDDLAAAFRSVFGDYSTEPGVTIDPDPQNPKAEQMIVRFFGGMENTHFGQILFEADRLMKALSLGTDNVSKKPVQADVKGYYNMLELGFSNLGGSYKSNLWSRFWLIPEQVLIKVAADKKSISFPDTRIRVKTETMRWQGGKLVPAKGEKDEKAEYFAGHFSRYYDEYAEQFPVYQELKTLANLVALAKWLKDKGVEADFQWLKGFDKEFPTPQKTPALTVEDERRLKSSRAIYTLKVSIFGGTDLTVKNMYIKDDGATANDAGKALLAVANLPGAAAASFTNQKNEVKTAVALPSSMTRAGGANMFSEEELGLLSRSYCSFHNQPGPFGYSWVIDLPQLRFSQPKRDKIEYTAVGNKRVMIRLFRMSAPFGLGDALFEKYTVDQEKGTIAVLPASGTGIRALYPDDEKGECRVEYLDGRADVFNSQGKIIQRFISKETWLKYSYDANNRLAIVDGVEGTKSSQRIKFFYDSKGRIAAAETNNGKFAYTYDGKGDLVQVAKGKISIAYGYNDQHLLTAIMQNGKPFKTFKYDSFGRLLTTKDASGKIAKQEIRLLDGKTEITEGSGEEKVVRVYDAGGRLLELATSDGEKIKNEYDESGRKKAMEYRNRFGDRSRVEYSPDARYVRFKLPDGTIRAFLFDEFGKLKQIQDGQRTLINREYGLTKSGSLETVQTAELVSQFQKDHNGNPLEELIYSKLPGGGQIQLVNQYGAGNDLQQTRMQGLIDEQCEYENGRIKTVINGGTESNYFYDPSGRLQTMESTAGRTTLSYDHEGRIKTIRLLPGKSEGSYTFSPEGLSSRKNLSGRTDTFNYDKEGRLTEMSKGDDEQWKFERSQNRLRILRNGKKYLEYNFDKQGRLISMIE